MADAFIAGSKPGAQTRAATTASGLPAPSRLERRLADLALQVEKYRTIFAQSNDAVFLAELAEDEPGRARIFVEVNEKASSWLGYTQDELCSMAPKDLVAPADRALLSSYGQTLANEKWITVELSLVAKSGRLIPVEMSARVFSLGGKPMGLFVARDFSRVKAFRDALAESAERWRSMTENCPDHIIIVSLDGTIRFLNRGIFGHDKDSLVGMNFFDHVPVAYRAFAETCVKKVFSDGKSQFHEIVITQPQGGELVIFMHLNPITVGGRITGAAARFVDVTERKRMERTLMENEARYRSFVESFIGIAYEMVPGSHRPVFFKGAVEAITGYTGEDFTSGGIKWEDLVHPLDRASRPPLLARTSGGDLSYRIINRQGKTVHVMESVKEMPGYGAPGRRYFGVIYDVTERKSRQELIEKRERELEETNSSLTEMNTTLGILLRRNETDKADMERNVSENLGRIIMPLLAKLKSSGLSSVQQSYLDAMENGLSQVVSGFGRTLSSHKYRLTPTEVQVSALVKDGHSTKDIAKMLNMSKSTVDTHRNNIRKKLEIKKQGVNLRAFLATLE